MKPRYRLKLAGKVIAIFTSKKSYETFIKWHNTILPIQFK